MRSEPGVQVAFADAVHLAGDPDERESALGSPVADSAGGDVADIGGGGLVGE